MKSPPPGPREPLQLLSVVIPARNEEGCIAATVEDLHLELRLHGIPHEIVAVDDGSTDGTWKILQQLHARIPECKPVHNPGEHGFGRAVVYGFDHAQGDAVVVMMADESDDCRNVVRYFRLLEEGWDSVFGSRFVRAGGVIDYPLHKLLLNRLANQFLRILFAVPFNDFTNAFKAYRMSTLQGCRPFLSPHFNLTVELPSRPLCGASLGPWSPSLGGIGEAVFRISRSGRWAAATSSLPCIAGLRNASAGETISAMIDRIRNPARIIRSNRSAPHRTPWCFHLGPPKTIQAGLRLPVCVSKPDSAARGGSAGMPQSTWALARLPERRSRSAGARFQANPVLGGWALAPVGSAG